MGNLRKRWSLGLIFSLALVGAAASPARALTRAGTPIDNTAYATYLLDGVQEEAASHGVRITVASLPALSLTPNYDRNVYPGQEVVLPHSLRNTGNTALRVRLALSSESWQGAVALDRNGNGSVDAGEEIIPSPLDLEPGEVAKLLITVTVPPSASEGASDLLDLRATDQDHSLAVSASDRLTVRSAAPAIIQLVAEPSVILGNGRDRARLTATVLTARGTPVADGTPVTFTTERGVFENGLQIQTLETRDGVAVTYLVAEIVSTVPVRALAKVVAGTPLTGTAEAEVEILFSPAAIAGLVSDHEGGRPVANLPAKLIGPDGSVIGSVATCAEGSYILYVPREGNYTLEIPVVNAVGELVVIRQRITVDRLGGAVFHPEGAVVGVVMSYLTREPIANTVLEFTLESVLLTGSRARQIRPGDRIRITTDARGGFAIDGLPLGRYVFQVTSADERHYPYGRVEVQLTRPGEYVVNANIYLDPFGYVYDEETGARIAGATVTLLDAVTGLPATPMEGENPTRTAADGTYRFRVVPGRYLLRAEAPGYRLLPVPTFDATRGVVNLNLPMRRPPSLGLEKRLDSAEAVPGGRLRYTLVVTNTGAGTARDVSIVDTLPQHVYPDLDTLGANATYDAASRRITWRLGDLAALTGRVELTFEARIANVLPEGSTSLVNTAYLVGPGIPAPGDAPSPWDLTAPVASAAAPVQVSAAPQLGIEKSTAQTQIVTGEKATFTIRFWNRGNAPATAVTVTDTLPAGLVAPDGSRTVTWRLDQLAAGAEETRVLEVIGDAAGLNPGNNQVTNRVTIASNTVAPVVATATLRVLVPYLRVTKRALVSEAESGDVVPFEILVENLSATEEATAVEVRDLLPAALHYRPGTARLNGQEGAEPQRAAGILSWRLERLAPGATARFTFHTIVAVGHGGPGEIVNTAEAVGTAVTGQRLAAAPSRAAIRRRLGFFSDRGLIIGRLFVDQNGNRLPDPGEPGLANVAVFTDSGMMAITDSEGKYVLPDVTPGEHVVRVDLTTVPAGYTPQVIDSQNARRPHSRFTRLSRGGLAKANFAFAGQGPTQGSARPGTPLLSVPEAAR